MKFRSKPLRCKCKVCRWLNHFNKQLDVQVKKLDEYPNVNEEKVLRRLQTKMRGCANFLILQFVIKVNRERTDRLIAMVDRVNKRKKEA